MVPSRQAGAGKVNTGIRKRRGGTGLLAEIHRALAPYALFQMKKHAQKKRKDGSKTRKGGRKTRKGGRRRRRR